MRTAQKGQILTQFHTQEIYDHFKYEIINDTKKSELLF